MRVLCKRDTQVERRRTGKLKYGRVPEILDEWFGGAQVWWVWAGRAVQK